MAFAAPFFNEFVLRGKNCARSLRRCAAEKIIPGIALEQWYPELHDCLLICVTEMNEGEEIEALSEPSQPNATGLSPRPT